MIEMLTITNTSPPSLMTWQSPILNHAKNYRDYQNKLSGKIKFIFQPAEEGGAGAAAMIADGVLKNPDVDVIFGQHNRPNWSTGLIQAKTGCVLSSRHTIEVTIIGKGGHAATPERTVDPIYIGTAIVQNLQGIVSRLTKPIEPCVLSVIRFNAGNGDNIIPDTATFMISLRTTSQTMTELALQKIQMISEQIATAYSATVSIKTIGKSYPATINTEAEVALVLNTAKQCYGEEKAHYLSQPAMASEDFSFYLEQIPGCYFFIGAGEKRPSCHNNQFDFNDEILPIAAEMLTMTAMNYLK